MGLETAAIVMMAVAGASTVAKAGFEIASADSQREALDLQSKEGVVEYQQKTLSNLDNMQKVLDAQEAAETTRGVAFSSPSFNAIQRQTLNVGAKNQQNTDTEESLFQANIDVEKQNVNTSLFSQLFGDAAGAAMAGAKIASSAPSSLPQME